MHAHKTLRIECVGQSRQRLPQQERTAWGMQMHIIASSFDPVNIVGLHQLKAASMLDYESLALACTQQRGDPRIAGAAAPDPLQCSLQRFEQARIVERLEQVVDSVCIEGAQASLDLQGNQQGGTTATVRVPYQESAYAA